MFDCGPHRGTLNGKKRTQNHSLIYHGMGIGDDRIAVAIQDHAPERSVSIWKTIAEGLIHQTKPCAYEQAVVYLRKAGKIMNQQNKQAEWDQYLDGLREKHKKKRRFIEILDQSDRKPIVKRH